VSLRYIKIVIFSILISKQCERDTIKTELTKRGLKHVSQYFKNIIYLQDMGVEIAGVKFYGSPWLENQSNFISYLNFS